MTVKADNRRRVVLPSAKAGDLFEVQVLGEGRLTLTRLEPIQDRPAPDAPKERKKVNAA
jgi:hypothetical protein